MSGWDAHRDVGPAAKSSSSPELVMVSSAMTGTPLGKIDAIRYEHLSLLIIHSTSRPSSNTNDDDDNDQTKDGS